MKKKLAVILNEDKIGLLLEYICSQLPHIHLRKLLKMVYLIDESSVRFRSFPMTWLDYYAWKKGPVAPEIYAIKDGRFSSYVSCHKEDDDKWHVTAKRENPFAISVDMRVFSEYEMDIINQIIANCRDKSADELTDETHHQNSLWSQVVERNHISFQNCNRSDFKIDLNELNDKDGKEIYEEALDCVMMQASLNSKSTGWKAFQFSGANCDAI